VKPALRIALGTTLSLLGLSGLFLFYLWQRALAGFSPDGIIQPYTWLILRIMLVALLAPALALWAIPPLRNFISTLDAALGRISSRRFLACTLTAAGTVRLLWIALAPLHMHTDWATYDELGWRLAQTGEYATATHLTMYRPVGYPFALSVIYRVFGHQPQVAVILNVLLGIGIVYLTYRLARRIWGERPARWAAAALVFFPSQILYLNLTSTEPLFTFLLLLGLLLMSAGRQPARSGLAWSAAAGMVIGLATLVRPVALLLPLVMLPLVVRDRRQLGRAGIRWFLLVISLAIVVSPWLIRNHRLSGRVLLSASAGINFYIGNNPNANFGFNRPDSARFSGYTTAEEARIDRMAFAEGWAFIRAHPIAFIKRGVLKSMFLLGTDIDSWKWYLQQKTDGHIDRYVVFAVFIQGYYYVFLLAVAAGLWRAVRDRSLRNEGTALMLLVLLYWLAVHFVFFGTGRFHYPIVPIMAGLAGLHLAVWPGSKAPADENPG
jgi:4-amino-4-deoxy-L-arabinose transferase-like glycosyltransferase